MAKSIQQQYKIGLYIRVSTEEQAENPEGSIRNQEDRLRQSVSYKNSQGNFGEIRGVFIDPGISAKDMRRPKLQELLRAVRAQEIDLVMVTELSRLSRNSRDFIEMWDMMRAHGCRFSSLREDFDTTTAAGEMVLFQLMNLAQFERKQTSERVEANMAARSARGLYNGGCVPVGYRTVAEKPGYLEVDPDMASVVQAAFSAFLREGSLSHAARWLNDNGYPMRKSKEGGGRFKRLGHFTVDNLQQMLRNKIYIGVKVYKHRDEVKEAKAVWPALIDESTFERAGKILAQNRRRYKPHQQGRMPYILSGIAFCKNCASHMPGKSATGNAGKVGYYEHAWATKRDATLSKKLFRCEPHRVPAKKIEPAAWEKIVQFVTDEKFTRRVLALVLKQHEINPLRRDTERLRAKIMGVNSQIEALSERLAELPKAISAAPIYKQMERLQATKEEHEALLLVLKRDGVTSMERIVGLDTFEDFAEHYRHFILTEMDVGQQKQMIQKFVSKIEMGQNSFKIHYIVDKEHYQRELALKKAGSRSFFRCDGSNTLTIGAQESGVDEPASSDISEQRLTCQVPIDFEIVVEPKELTSEDLRRISLECGSYRAASRILGISEAFIRQKAQNKTY